MSKKPYDQAFKYLAEQDAESLLILLGHLKPNQKAKIERLPLELSASTILTDQTYLVTTEFGESIIHPEAQTQWTDDLLSRIPDYDARIWMTHRLPIFSSVLMLTPKGLPRRVPRVARIKAGGLEIRVHFKLVKLWEFSAKRVLAMRRENLLPFIPLMKGGTPELEIAAQYLRDIKDERKQCDLGIHFLMLGGLRYNRADILELIVERGMIPIEQFKDSSVYQMIFEEGEKKGEKRAEKRAEKRGEKRGEINASAQALLKIIAKRFPNVEVSADIQRLKDPVILQKLLVEALDMPNAKALKKRLAEILKK